MTGWGRPAGWEQALFGETGDFPRVVLRGLRWRAVASYLQELGGRLMDPAEGQKPPVQARLAGDGWQATLREHVEFVGALRVNRVEVRFSGEARAVEEVVAALRRMALLDQA